LPRVIGGKPMKVWLGPVMGLRGATDREWHLSVLLVIDVEAPPDLVWRIAHEGAPQAAPAPRLIGRPHGQCAWRYELQITRDAQDSVIEYSLGDIGPCQIIVPAAGAAPRMAYASCNGFSNPRDMKRIKNKNALWSDLLKVHSGTPFHLLLLGGDQVYSDALWEQVPPIKRWAELRRKRRLDAPFDAGMREAVDKFFFDLYWSRWSQREPQQAFASIPTLMMWDDHDIFDGWGSYPDNELKCDVFREIFGIARAYFRMFQLQLGEGETLASAIPGQAHFTYGHHLGSLTIVALDMRSERTETQVMSKSSWDAAYAWMEALPEHAHLLVMTSIPVVHPDFSVLERLLGRLPGRQELEDDLKDHWNSRTHKEERLRFIHRLLALSAAKRCRVTLLSGDVHVAAVGIIDSRRSQGSDRYAQVINQLTSSGIVHPPPPGMALHFLESMGDKVEEPDRDLTTRMLPFPGTEHRFIGCRNWLSLTPDSEGRIWCEWHVEGEPRSFTKVVHPCTA